MKKIYLLFIFFALFISCTKTPQLIINGEKIFLEISQDNSKGLMFRESLTGGMLFIFEGEKPRNFWMKNVNFPIDIIFLDKNKIIVDLKKNFEPCRKDPCEEYKSKPAMYVIELNSGFVKQNNARIGQTVQLDNI